MSSTADDLATVPAAPGGAAGEDTDEREALFNDRAQGPVKRIQMPLARITVLHGILFDLDPGMLRPGNPVFPPADEPEAFYRGIRGVLDRHPLARKAEVRASGTGLHVIVLLRPPVELRSQEDQKYWDRVVRAVQRTLPSDPQMPGITALTRPVGAINSKRGAEVKLLQEGEPVSQEDVRGFLEQVTRAPFRELARILLGNDRVAPCPVCQGANTRLDLLEHQGRCYGGCGEVGGARLLDSIYRPQ